MQFYDYIYRDSIIHNLDPRTKIAWLVGLSFLVFSTNNHGSILLTVILLLLSLLFSKLPLTSVWNSSKTFLLLLIPYTILFSVLSQNIQQGIIDGTFFTLKFLILILSTVIFAMTTSPRDLMIALTKLKIPYELAFMLTIAIRFVPVITKEINRVIDAQKARAHTIAFKISTPIESAKTFLPIIIPTLHLLLIRAFELSLSIEARAFRAKPTRTFPPRLRFHARDVIGGIGLILFFLVFS